MEGLKFGWRRTARSDTYHYIRDFSHKANYETITSLCTEKSIEVGYAKTKIFLKEFEIDIQYNICHTCKLKLEQIKQNDSKKETLAETNEMSVRNGYVLQKVICAEETCDENGTAFVSINDEEKPHYCIKHNLLVQETIKKEKKLVVIQ